MNILKKITIVFFSLLFSSMTVAADDSALGDLSQYTVMLCGKVSNEVLDDVGSHEKSEPLSKMIDLLILISTDALTVYQMPELLQMVKYFSREGIL